MRYFLSYSVFVLIIVAVFLCVWFAAVNSNAIRDNENLNDLEKNGELIFAHVIYRHGDRNPVAAIPGSYYNDISYWPAGWGQLTTLGIQQQFALGEWLRRRYNNFLSSTFNVNDIYVQSSDVDRTLMSAQSNLAGLYPPLGNNIWNKNLLWQPIPIHSMPVSMDYLIAGAVPTCPSYENAYNQYMGSDEMIQFRNSIQPIFEYLTTKIGFVIDDLMLLLLIRDTWLCDSIHNFTLPEWANELYPNNKEFDRGAMKFYQIPTATKFMAKFMSGFLLKDILDRFTSKVEDTLTPNRKLWMYSTHDSTVFSLLDSLDISNNEFVPYTGTIILEMRQYQNQYYIQIFYKTSEELVTPIEIPGCGIACSLSQMYEIYDNILPKNDFNTECKVL